MLKGLGDLSKMGGMLKQAMEVKQRIESLKEQLVYERVEGSAGGGMVHVEMNGRMEVLGVRIEPEVLNAEGREMLETLVQAAVNDAIEKTQALVKAKMGELTGGFEIPGIT